MKVLLWKRKDGVEILISDMATSHIENCLELTRRSSIKNPFNSSLLDILEALTLELESRSNPNNKENEDN